jgi:dihydrofolate synthase / folylpolyglutamate synthase
VAKPTETWVASLSPWPEEFGVDRMREILEELGEPQRAYPAVHVVGTKGKSTAARTIGALLSAEGYRVGVYTSPHVSGWQERIHVDGADADFEQVVARVRPVAERLGATQFEVLTAAAFAEFAAARLDVAVVEAGLGGRLDATNVIDARVVLLTNVGREHMQVLGETLEEIAREKLDVAHAASVVVLPDNTYGDLVPHARVVLGGARETAEAFAGHSISTEVDVQLPGRFERRGTEIRDGAHTPEAVDWLLDRLPSSDYVLCVSILDDKDAAGILERLARAGSWLVATTSSHPRALPAEEIAERARPYYERVDAVADPRAALARARELAGSERRVLVTGSLYLLADLHSTP